MLISQRDFPSNVASAGKFWMSLSVGTHIAYGWYFDVLNSFLGLNLCIDAGSSCGCCMVSERPRVI